MINALLIDDEPANSAILEAMLLQYCPSVAICGKAANIDDAQRAIALHEPQLIFLDIQMPGGSGFDLLDRMLNKNTEVVFVTAYDNFLLKAIRYSALDYLMKPINLEDLQGAVSRAEERISKKVTNRHLELLLSNIQPQTQVQRIAIPYRDEYLFVPVNDIVRLEAKGAYTDVVLANGKRYLASRNIKEYEDLLPVSLFARVHHAHLVNLSFVKTYHKGRGGYLVLQSGETVEVAARRKDDFINRFR